jgi:hypothetical protein
MFSRKSFWLALFGAGLLVSSIAGCTALREVSNLRKAQFAIDRISNPRLAGMDLFGFESYEDLGTTDVLRLGSSLSDGELPMAFTVNLEATNPSSNSANVRLTAMDWTLLLEDKETVAGRFEREVILPPGEPKSVAVQVELDLVRFFEDNLRGLVNLASAIVQNEPPQTVKLRVQPTVNTALGPIEYPSPITVVSKRIGRDESQP